MLNIIPAIDILEGNVVRLYKGDYNKATQYKISVEEQTLEYKNLGVRRMHIVDLDGAKAGKPINIEAIKKSVVIADSKMEIEVGGGIRSLDDIKRYIDIGVNYIILGTKAINDFDFLANVVSKYGSSIIVGLDVKDGKPAVSGWRETSNIDTKSLFKIFEDIGVQTIIYTDISTDGTLSGVNIENIKYNLSLSKMNYIVSGGVSSINDITNLVAIEDKNLSGVIIGRAIYEKKIDLTQALNITLNK